MTDRQINFLLHQYLRDHRLDIVEMKSVREVLKTADKDTVSVIAMLMMKRSQKETVQ